MLSGIHSWQCLEHQWRSLRSQGCCNWTVIGGLLQAVSISSHTGRVFFVVHGPVIQLFQNFHLLKISYSFINTSLFSLHSLQTCHNAQIEQRLCQGGANSVCHLAIPRSTRFVRCLHSIATANSLGKSLFVLPPPPRMKRYVVAPG